MIERTFKHLPVHLPFPLHQFAFADVGSDGQLPVRTGFALRNDILRFFAVGNNLPRNLQPVVFNAGGNHADPRIRLVLMVG